MNLFDHHYHTSSSSSKLTSFEPSEFLSESFSVDEFIQRKRYTVPLDVLRDDLGSHLKFLRSSLIELINQDYGQFVSLSSNLYGLDGKIQNITGPLSRAQAELKTLDDTLAVTLKNLNEEQEHRKSLRSTRVQLQLLRRIHKLLDSSEKYLNGNETDDFKILKLTCDKVSDIKYLINKSASSPLRSDFQWRFDKCCSILLSKLAVSLRTSALNIPNEDVERRTCEIKSILQMYVQLSSESLAESVFTADILKPSCDSVLSSKGNINSLFNEVEQVLQNSLLLQVAKEDHSLAPKYDFVTNCILYHVASTLTKQFPHIWSPSVPDSFHSNWRRCEAFIVKLEENLPSLEHLNSFRNSEVLINFLSKWQFNVYFQLRFHTLAVELESALDTLHAPCVNEDFRLDSTRVLIRVLNQCWDTEKIFILQLSGRFLKASALFISRYLQEISATTSKSNNLLELIRSHCDISLLELVILQFLQPKILECVQDENSSSTSTDFLKDFAWDEANQLIESRITDITVSQSIIPISSVTEVPRLFRRTNREVPTKPSDYVNGILEPIRSLHKTIREAKGGEELFERIGEKISQTVANRFIVQVEEVLVSVQRMEESLKRLKKVKGARNAGNATEHTNNSMVEKSGVLSDDDKIRLQIKLDLEYFTSELKNMCPNVTVDTKNIFNLQLLGKKL